MNYGYLVPPSGPEILKIILHFPRLWKIKGNIIEISKEIKINKNPFHTHRQ